MIEWAKKELERIKHDSDGVQDRMDKYVLEILQVFCNQGHSNHTAPYVMNIVQRLVRFMPLTPLTGEDDEWTEVSNGLYQNKRYSAVFKEADGKAYNSEGKIFTNDGITWFTNINSRIYIEFPYVVPDEPEKIFLKETQRMNDGKEGDQDG
ncbi:MAG: hypothetical protein IKF29_00425 [Oceanobacillus sp.]|nr:hypothetical protein [Oceanobacillus sp.]